MVVLVVMGEAEKKQRQFRGKGFSIVYPITKISVHKHCFCHLNVQNVKQKNSLSHQPMVLWLAC